MATTVNSAFATYLSRLTPTGSERETARRHRGSIETALEPLGYSLLRETGSFRHGTGVRFRSDIDYLVSLDGERPASSDSALTRVRNRLQAAYPNTTINVRRPAVVVNFAGGDEQVEVVPGYFKRNDDGENVYAIPGAASGWIESAPNAHLKYVNECNAKEEGGRAKGLARLAKAWKYQRRVPVSSFYLEMRAARYAAANKPVIYSIDLRDLLHKLRDNDLGAMNDPGRRVGRIYATSGESYKEDALSRLDRAVFRADKAREAETAGRTKDAFDWWDRLFNGAFPAYG